MDASTVAAAPLAGRRPSTAEAITTDVVPRTGPLLSERARARIAAAAAGAAAPSIETDTVVVRPPAARPAVATLAPERRWLQGLLRRHVASRAFAAYACVQMAAIYAGWGSVVFIVSLLLMLWRSLAETTAGYTWRGERKVAPRGYWTRAADGAGASAYSVFNEGGRALDGQLTARDFETSFGYGRVVAD
ncbi:hypothetical protein CXG81DRAFT_23836 [Caulochytrium protostelioides]|uniref:SAYSvFN domain-containing protein n=1 Tax=Caulochytrium protostelioides TaxID=1555241 RepID=A0A4P9XDM6_9FUNG|nr:hypothetical protein CXG81DRAFT_23836 [Caulochytrium protostelioides]|eukprot:RKP03578.1 hypothetical protein CXG81DRAFT_23836 [Caulochytrium protostelioides]